MKMVLELDGRIVEVEIQYEKSAVDSFISSGYFMGGDMRDLTDQELETLQQLYTEEVQQACFERVGYFER
jgi:hypothetical protein